MSSGLFSLIKGRDSPASSPSCPIFDEPWREVGWGNNERDLQYVRDYQPDSTELQHLRILLYGPVGSGKSSFINSVNNVLQGRITALEDISSCSFTPKYIACKIQKGNPRTFYPLVFSDTMGLDGQTNSGVHPEDVKLAMRGHMRDGYKFNPVSEISTEHPGYNSSPTLNDKVHVLVCVIPAHKVSLLTKEVVQKMRDIRLAASDMGIPQLAVLTRIDEACPEIQKNTKNVYKSKYLKTQMEEFSALMGFPMNCIFPVKNYHSEIQIKDDVDSLILSALRQMIYFGEDFVNSLSVFDEPWREVRWGNKGRDLQYVKAYQPDNTELQHLRILLYGPVGAGKSSFFNSVNSVLRGRVTYAAPTDSAVCGSSFTITYTTYKIQKGDPETFYPFVFNDIMGLEDQTNRGVHPEDVKLAMKGHVRDGYMFNPLSKISTEHLGYNSSPTLNDKVHVLVCVVSADKVSLLGEEVVQKMRDIRLAARDMGIPHLAVLTNIDEVCPEIQKNIRNVYKSKYLKTQMQTFSELMGFPLNCIFPVKNYHTEIQINDDVDSLILSALKRMINIGEDFVNGM